MSTPHLPPELLDHIIDLLRDSQAVLRNCCLVSKSWIPHIRRHLFVGIGFDTTERLRSWKETFLDPSTSPAKYTKTLIIRCIQAVTAADAEEGGWIRGFSSVECLEVSGESAYPDGSMISLLPFRGFSPALKSLRVNLHFLPSSQVFDLVLSFPLLEDLNVMSRNMSIDDDDDDDNDSSHGLSTVVQPSSPPMTGFLELFERGGMGSIARRLMSLPGGIHFQNLALKWSSEEDVLLSMALVDKCSHTLEYLEIACGFRCGCLGSASIDLSRAIKLKESVFRVESQRVDWITTMLRTIIPEHPDFPQITIYLPYDPSLSGAGANVRRTAGEQIFGQWLELDRLLVQLCESRSIRPKVLYLAPWGTEGDITECVGCLLPESLGRGITDLAQWIF